MKISVILFMAMVMIGFNFAYGESEINTDKTAYYVGETVKISISSDKETVVLQIKDEVGKTLVIRTLQVNNNETFDFKISSTMNAGKYEAVISVIEDNIPVISSASFDVMQMEKTESASSSITIEDRELEKTTTEDKQESIISAETPKAGGGCLIATAAFDSELAPQVQKLREIRDSKLLYTESGTQFMESFNSFYYSFSPIIADYERENPVFKEMVKIGITPMISTLSLMDYADTESEVLGIGISLIILNAMMYVGLPVFGIMIAKKRF